MRLCYVVLHYQNIGVTKDCIRSLLKIKGEGSQIVVVDNASPNKSGLQLKNIFGNDNDIHVIINDSNTGFAKGNNIGFLYAKQHLHADNIVVMNSDVIIEQVDFENKIFELNKKRSVHIIAPDIKTLDEKHQNPFRINRVRNYTILRACAFYSLWIITMKIPMFNKVFLKNINQIMRKKISKGNFVNDCKGNIIPHGSCLIYTEKYVNEEDIAFLPITFLFHEEDILYEYASSKGYVILYSPTIRVNHLEDASINEITTSSISREIFNSKYRLRSLITLLMLRMGFIKY